MQDIKIPNYITKEIDNTNMDILWKSNMDLDNKHVSYR